MNIEKIQQLLEKQKVYLLEKVNNRPNCAQRSYNPNRSDLASRYTQNQRDILLWERAEQQLQDVDKALKRINDGTYGQCEYCGQEIHSERLESIPTTSLCIKCRGLTKKQGSNEKERKREEEKQIQT